MYSLKQATRDLMLTADLLEVLGEDSFRAQAYRSAARSLEASGRSWAELTQAGFAGLPKVGKALSAALQEAEQSGNFGPLQEATQQLPAGLLELLQVRGLGPKKVRALWQAGFSSPEALREGLQSGAVSGLRGFGGKAAEGLLAALDFLLSAKGRLRLDTALDLSQEVCRAFPDFSPSVSGEAACGLETAHAAGALLNATEREALAQAPTEWQLRSTSALTLSGEQGGLRLELYLTSAEARGAAQVWRACAPEVLKELTQLAAARGLSFSEGGLRRGEELISTPTEADFWRELGQAARPAEYREPEHGALWPQLPPADALIRVGDIRGYLHTHTQASDGAATLSEMARAAREMGPECYLGTADHSQAAHYARGLSPERLRAQLKEVAELRRAGLNILAGSEVDILEDGRLDFDDDLLSELDYVVASVHSHFQLDQVQQTERVLRAVSHPLITVLGHPTGRLLLRRPAYDLDLEAVLERCAEREVAVEINASPQRLDLDWRWALRYRGKLRFAINTDAHSVGGLQAIRYGVLAARKAGLRPEDVVNTLTAPQFLAVVAAQRRGRA